MPVHHAPEFRELTDVELATQLEHAHQELFNLRFQIATRKLKNNQRLRAVRREIARIHTVARERELDVLYQQAQAALSDETAEA